MRPWGRAVIKHYRGGFMRRGWHRVGAFLAHVLGREREDERYELPAAERRALENWENFESIVELTRHFNCDAAALLREAKGPDRLTHSLDNLFTDAAAGAAVDAAAKQHAVDVASRGRRAARLDTLALLGPDRYDDRWRRLGRRRCRRGLG